LEGRVPFENQVEERVRPKRVAEEKKNKKRSLLGKSSSQTDMGRMLRKKKNGKFQRTSFKKKTSHLVPIYTIGEKKRSSHSAGKERKLRPALGRKGVIPPLNERGVLLRIQ